MADRRTADDLADYDLGGHGVGALLVVRIVLGGATPHRVIVAGMSPDGRGPGRLGRVRASTLVLTTPGQVYPDGDHFLYVTRDLRLGTFGHPREHVLCVFGQSLVAQVEQPLIALLGPPVRRS